MSARFSIEELVFVMITLSVDLLMALVYRMLRDAVRKQDLDGRLREPGHQCGYYPDIPG